MASRGSAASPAQPGARTTLARSAGRRCSCRRPRPSARAATALRATPASCHGLLGGLQREVDHGVAVAVGPRVVVRRPDIAPGPRRAMRRADSPPSGALRTVPDRDRPVPDAFPEGGRRRALRGDGADAGHDHPDRLSIRCGHDCSSSAFRNARRAGPAATFWPSRPRASARASLRAAPRAACPATQSRAHCGSTVSRFSVGGTHLVLQGQRRHGHVQRARGGHQVAGGAA